LTTPSDPTAVVPQDDPPTPSQSRTPPHPATLCIPSPPIILHDGRQRNIQSVPELEENLTPINSKFLDLPPSSPIQSPLSVASHDDFDDDILNFEYGPGDLDCCGQWVQWTLGPIWNTYPYQRHDKSSLPWVPIGWRTGWIQLRSLVCAWQLVTEVEKGSGTCSVCHDLLNSRALIKLMERASANKLEPRIPWSYLTTTQLKALLLEKEKKIQLLKVRHGRFSDQIINFIQIGDEISYLGASTPASLLRPWLRPCQVRSVRGT
jgi:hypothetical protein